MKREDKTETRLPEPFVDPVVAARNPAAAAYARQMKERMGGDPRGGGPPVPIPPLNMPHTEGMTMADQAQAARPQALPTPTIFTQETASQVAGALHKGILTTDTLPEQAKQDPMYREGHGSMYAVNQTNLAHKYGVIRNGRHIAPQELSTGKQGLRQQTVEGLKAVQEFQQKRQDAMTGDALAEKAATDGPAGQAAQIAGAGAAPVSSAERTQAEEALKNMDDFDFNEFREVMLKDLLNNDEQRQIVEERLKPLELTELIINGRVSQVIPVRPGEYEPELQSMTGEEELALKRLLMEERKNLAAPDRYLLDKYQLMTVALGIRSINKHVFPEHLDANGQFNDEKFWQKFNKVLRLPFHLLASIGVHYYWFDVRVRKLFVAERIKNG